ncbi:phage baseplate assembly protein V [Bradyrhizobium liaoningense]|uniref:phage baseplate assembly protein V n=1 Tax=Bradyrhizobium liaoningense TaxID=43992 RepID=UPI001BAE5460|nr:phage baseplate assembly protein V [Bradyrhizobium liaoningense]MBR0713543.1 baseplate assembly protein [Bradyrhizobium liaoningense]
MTTTTTSPEIRTYYGKYRGTVINNVDPLLRGRLLLEVPDVTGLVPSSWAEPCVPLAGPSGPPMGVYMVPPIGAGVWVEFERGDPSKPIWVGCRWGLPSDVPPLALAGLPVSPNICMQTLGQNMLMLSDMPPTPATGGIILKSLTGATLVVNDLGIFIQNGKGASITLIGPAVDINMGALTVI